MKERNDLLALFLVRLRFLKPGERWMLYGLFRSHDAWERLDGAELSSLIGRDVRGKAPDLVSARKDAGKDLSALGRRNISLVLREEGSYPVALSEIHDPPFALFARGDIRAFLREYAAVVGTRAPTAKGRASAFRIAKEISSSGIGVVSGLARGIDAWAHRGALSGGGTTVAVLGSGPDRVYPVSNSALAAEILDSGGAIASEYPPGTDPFKWHFPERNRIIAGMARITIVAEAPVKSGALITSQFALDEGRDVGVLQDTLGDPRSAGCSELERDGARVVSNAADIADCFRSMALENAVTGIWNATDSRNGNFGGGK